MQCIFTNAMNKSKLRSNEQKAPISFMQILQTDVINNKINMFNLKIKLSGAALALILIACNERNEDVTETVNKSGSVETAVHIGHIDSLNDELVTTHKVWVKNNVFKTVEYHDTIPALGNEAKLAENQEGDTKNVTVKKEYEIYITVK